MGLTRQVDLKLLHECFELDPYDNLLKPEIMDAVRMRRDLIRRQMQRKEDNAQIAKLLKLKEETMQCHIIAQRIGLQEYLASKWDEIEKSMDSLIADPEVYVSYDRAKVVGELFPQFLAGFKIHQPSQYFIDNEYYDAEIVGNVENEQEFMITTLEMFGLIPGYMGGAGHWATWEEDQAKLLKKGKGGKKAKGGKVAAKSFMDKKREAFQAEKAGVVVKPTHFDLEPLRKAVQRFLACNGQVRADLRTNVIDFAEAVRGIFRDENNELSFKKCVDINQL